MKNIFFMGGTLFMSILTILLVIMITWILYHFIAGYNSKESNLEIVLRRMGYGKSIGLFAMITGIFGQLIGFYEAFSAIENVGDISPGLVYGGIKVSMITTLYGISIYLTSLMLWFAASIFIERKLEKKEK
jgi:biopolymer transport protein ExbB/TolQ